MPASPFSRIVRFQLSCARRFFTGGVRGAERTRASHGGARPGWPAGGVRASSPPRAASATMSQCCVCMESTGEKSVVRSRRTDGTRDSRCATSVGRVPRVRPRDEDEHLSRFARRARPPRRDFRHALPGGCFTPRRDLRTDHPPPPPSFAGARELRPRVPPLVHPPVVQLQEGCGV